MWPLTLSLTQLDWLNRSFFARYRVKVEGRSALTRCLKVSLASRQIREIALEFADVSHYCRVVYRLYHFAAA